MENFTQRNNTRNQSTGDYSFKHIFLFDNKYSEAEFLNNTGAELTLQAGTLVIPNSADGTQVVPAIAGATIANVVGAVKLDGDVVLAIGETLAINYGHSGTVNKDYLILPDGVTLTTVEGGKTVVQHLEALGMDLEGAVNNTKFDN